MKIVQIKLGNHKGLFQWTTEMPSFMEGKERPLGWDIAHVLS